MWGGVSSFFFFFPPVLFTIKKKKSDKVDTVFEKMVLKLGDSKGCPYSENIV